MGGEDREKQREGAGSHRERPTGPHFGSCSGGVGELVEGFE